eukprot:COSAG02_NODE_17751_length_984_cov_0.725424_2_plen_91_part_01
MLGGIILVVCVCCAIKIVGYSLTDYANSQAIDKGHKALCPLSQRELSRTALGIKFGTECIKCISQSTSIVRDSVVDRNLLHLLERAADCCT